MCAGCPIALALGNVNRGTAWCPPRLTPPSTQCSQRFGRRCLHDVHGFGRYLHAKTRGCQCVRNKVDVCHLDEQSQTWHVINVHPRLTEVNLLLGDPTKARDLLGWTPKITMTELCHMMVDADLKLAERERTLVDAGYTV